MRQIKREIQHTKTCELQHKAVLRRKFIEIYACINKKERSQISNLTIHLKEVEKEELIPKLVEGRKL